MLRGIGIALIDSSVQYYATSLGILNYPTPIQDLILDGTITVHRATPSHFSAHHIHYAEASIPPLEASTIVVVTGWSSVPSIKFLPEGIDAALGIPSTAYTDDET